MAGLLGKCRMLAVNSTLPVWWCRPVSNTEGLQHAIQAGFGVFIFDVDTMNGCSVALFVRGEVSSE